MPPKKKQKTASKTTKKQATTPAKKLVRVNFTDTEDIFICKAWINVSQNAITGRTDQKGLMFWSKVHSMFRELVRQNKDDLPAHAREVRRDKTAVKNQFYKLIQKKTLLYNVCYRRVKSTKPSGTTEEDIHH
jgi:hypothetical protein